MALNYDPLDWTYRAFLLRRRIIYDIRKCKPLHAEYVLIRLCG